MNTQKQTVKKIESIIIQEILKGNLTLDAYDGTPLNDEILEKGQIREYFQRLLDKINLSNIKSKIDNYRNNPIKLLIRRILNR